MKLIVSYLRGSKWRQVVNQDDARKALKCPKFIRVIEANEEELRYLEKETGLCPLEYTDRNGKVHKKLIQTTPLSLVMEMFGHDGKGK